MSDQEICRENPEAFICWDHSENDFGQCGFGEPCEKDQKQNSTSDQETLEQICIQTPEIGLCNEKRPVDFSDPCEIGGAPCSTTEPITATAVLGVKESSAPQLIRTGGSDILGIFVVGFMLVVMFNLVLKTLKN